MAAASVTPTREHAWTTLATYATSEAVLHHALALEAATAGYARRFGEDEEQWRVAALLHEFRSEVHRPLGAHPAEVIEAVLAQAEARDTLLGKTLFACDELSRFVHACGLMRPTGLDGLEPRFVRRRLKQPAFAAGVSRDDIAAGPELLGVELDDHIANVIEALRPIARDLGLRTAEDTAGAPERYAPSDDARGARRTPMVSDVWYAQYFGLDQLAMKGGRLGLYFLRAAWRRELIITYLTSWAVLAAILSSVLRRRQVVLLELQRLPVSGWRALALRLTRRFVGRGIAAAHVLSSWEIEACHNWLGIPSDRIRFIPWPLYAVDPGPETRSGYVFASGRAACDWETLFRAAEEADWRLIVVCSEPDAREVARLNSQGRAQVFVEIPRDAHHRLLKEASVYVLPLVERYHSAGVVRIMDAIGTMTPVVTTAIKGLADYVLPGESALVVKPGDAAALGQGIERLLEDRALRRRLTERALDTFGRRTAEDYEKEIQSLVYGATES